MKALIASGVPVASQVWADLGAGTGNFTFALAELLPAGSAIYAVDQHDWVLRQVGAATPPPQIAIHVVVADITRALDLPPLDGILMANALHWMGAQEDVLRRCAQLLVPHGRLILVEYDTDRSVSWVPKPVPPRRFASLARAAGFEQPRIIGTRRSPTNGSTMYAAVATRSET